MDAAVSAKKYAEAEQYRVRLTELAEEKALAVEKESSSNNPSSPMDPVAKVSRCISGTLIGCHQTWKYLHCSTYVCRT